MSFVAGNHLFQANPRGMKRAFVVMLCIGAIINGADAIALAQSGSSAPRAVLVATTTTETLFQTGRAIYSTWDGEEFDRSRPPIYWPKALEVSGSSTYAIDLPTQDAPFLAQVRAWERLRPNGKPKGKPEISECGPPTTSGTASGCTLTPSLVGGSLGWRINFDLQRSTGPYYLAISASWDEGQVAWINHLVLSE